MECRVVLKNVAGDRLRDGGHPVTVSVFDVAGKLLVIADSDNKHRKSSSEEGLNSTYEVCYCYALSGSLPSSLIIIS
jgi:hypothetical protein